MHPYAPIRLLLLPASLLLFWAGNAPAAEAQTIPSPYDFIETRHDGGLYVGRATENRGTVGLGPGGGTLVGARYGIHLGGAFSLEGNAFLLPSDRDVLAPELDDAGAIVRLGNASSLVGGLDGRLRFTVTGHRTWHRLAPYLTAGGGIAGDLSPRSSLEDDLVSGERFTFGPSFLGLAGGGTRWLPTDRFEVRLEGTLNLWRLGTPREFLTLEPEDLVIPENEWVGVGAFVVGVSYRF